MSQMIKVVQLQYSNKSAGSSALRLHRAFLESGIDSKIISFKRDNLTDPGIKYLGKKSELMAWLDEKFQNYINKKTIKKYGLFSYPVFGTDLSQMEEITSSDVIYFHWTLMGFLNLRSIRKISKLNKPVVFIMHDMWYLTGGCHYSFDCRKYEAGCYNCQAIKGEKHNDLSTKGFKKKLKLFSSFSNFYFISPSKWLFNCAKNSLLLKDKPLFYIPNAIDESRFKSFEEATAKNILDIDEKEIVIAFGATSVDSPFKGWQYLQKALCFLTEHPNLKNISVLIFGSGYNKKIADEIPFKTKFLGFLNDEYSLAIAYNAATVFVVPSLADNQPTTIMESLLCGTPVVGFDVGGIPDMIIHKENGFLAKYKDPLDLANGIIYCIENKLTGTVLPSFKKSEVIKKHVDLMIKTLHLS
jgi:glycosyltransferase involved in cell wall biosynthesis